MSTVRATIMKLAILFSLAATTGWAEERVALVIGNGAYRSITPLDNPVNDAVLMASQLELAGFEVIQAVDTDQATMKRSIAAFGRRLRNLGPEATGLFYYAGHGIQSFGANYLLPVDTELSDAADLPLVGVDAQSVLQQMHSARNRTNIVILDACRNNPFEQIREFTDNGLAEMRAPTGTFLSYATEPGGVALDGLGGNSPFTQSLAEKLIEPGLAIEQVFKQVRVSVLEQTKGRQTPWDTSSLTADFQFVALPEPERPDEAALIGDAQSAGSVEAYLEYLRYYPDGAFAELARVEIAALSQTKAPVPAPEPPSDGAVTFSAQLPSDDPVLAGKSIEDLIASTPLFSPIEGLPEQLWKDQPCANCHQWTRDDLCVQANVYASADGTRSLSGEHPLGTAFKSALSDWARNDCR
ncbi:MAG: caspase domain-containing protein [Pseudomonadota bacterium]